METGRCKPASGSFEIVAAAAAPMVPRTSDALAKPFRVSVRSRAAQPVRDRTRRSAEPPPRFAIGHGALIAGTYELGDVLGSGGMGIVYEATDVHLGRRVAIKLANEAHADALRREGSALGALRHPGVPSVHGFGRHGSFAYLVMEAIGGVSLARRLEQARDVGAALSIDEVFRILGGVAAALAAVHAAGIVHRDVKASNVILAGSRVVLLDFGIMLPELEVGSNKTIAGSPRSMAPEQIEGSARRGSGARMDLYALGVLAFEMLALALPFDACSVTAMFAAHVGAPIPDVRDRRGDTPADLAELVASLMAKDPADRPDSAEAVLETLDAIRKCRSDRARRVMIVDDDRHIGKALRVSLESSFPKLEVDAFHDPARAISRIEAAPPGLVLVDLNMPEVNGVELAMRILAMPAARRPAVVAMSAGASAEDQKLLGHLGVRAFVPKDDDLVDRMNDVIGELCCA